MQVGINVEARRRFLAGHPENGQLCFHHEYLCRGVEYNELTKPFVDTYVKDSMRHRPTHRYLRRYIVYTLAPALRSSEPSILTSCSLHGK